MKRHEQDQLLNEILAGEEVTEFRRTSLARTLGAIQRRKRRRRLLGASALVLPLLLASVLWLNRSAKSPGTPAPVVQAPPAGKAPAEARSVKFITDEELFALFPDRPMALIGPPGRQQLVFLDKPAARRAAHL